MQVSINTRALDRCDWLIFAFLSDCYVRRVHYLAVKIPLGIDRVVDCLGAKLLRADGDNCVRI